MTPTIDFSVALLAAVAQFLESEPMIYLFGVILLCWVCKAIKTFFT